MDLSEVMRTTGAVRAFRPEPVPDELLYEVLDTARFAPSGGNKQPWTVLVVDDQALRTRLRELAQLGWREYMAHVRAGVRPFAPGPDGRWHSPAIDLAEARRTPAPSDFVDNLDAAPVLLVVLVRLTDLAVMDVEADRHSVVGGASIYPFAQNILLAARNMGLGGTLTTFLARQEAAAKPLLGIPDDHAIAAVVALGFPERPVRRLTRRPVEQFAHRNRFDGPAWPARPDTPTSNR